ncbi:Pre-mRNA-splicing factor ATP-dependent RNA helicase cdc28 [Hyphodiscus hymeniophilus]|uniref:Pre-mRNA-splicing factor ATP-dependent RNA helicase cdc28 n=1 Tax=Hyphodiscus hymeniophilus TaxID=353542 RepID=A0A9P6SMQ5_9HELO|nr:Pre-mRNA-splicing factor ATP-dependent RNA helicase cdc28 [Hyphodiscus hymeniophilus]
MPASKYAFVPMDEEEVGPTRVEKKEKRRHRDKKKRQERSRERSPRRESEHHRSKTIRKQDTNDDDRWGDEEYISEEEAMFQQPSPKRMKIDREESPPNETEEERADRIDREERDAFAKRLQTRDADKTKKIVEDRSSTKEGNAMAQRRALAEDAAARSAALPDLRERSRQDYLKKRETERLALLRKQVAEETEELRSGARLSEKEKAEFAKNREVLRIAEERLRIDDHLDGYAMPDDYFTEKGKIDKKKKEDAMYKRYVDRDEYGMERYVTEHEEWERDQASKAKSQVKSTERVDQGEYDYILDEEQGIKWLIDSATAIEGMTKEQAFLASQLDAAEKKAQSIEDTRKSLPIYGYRDEFLSAISDHQILVVVGETGSGKTTQLTQYLHEAGYTKDGLCVGCTQPRRVAAMSVAARVSDEIGCKVGTTVGYSIRFENQTSDKTVIKYLTGYSQPLGGDILVFLTGEEEIEAAATNIEEICRKLGSRIPELIVARIYSALPSDQQAKIFEPTPPNARKVVLATNIAETSLTIDGIVYVIDPGFEKQNVFNPTTGLSQLVTVPCSRASANQRKGRAGRVGPGKCFRLYTKWAFYNEMEESTMPEILRADLCPLTLTLKSLGVNDVLGFDWIDSPSPEVLIQALTQLFSLQALNHQGALTKIGRKMAELPINPMAARSILAADALGCVEEIVSIIAMLDEAGSLFFRPKDKKIHADSARARFTVKEGGDMTTYLNIFSQWCDADFSPIWAKENFLQQRSLTRARDVKDQLLALCERVEVTMSSCGSTDVVPIQKAILSGYFVNSAKLERGGDSYRTMKKSTSVYIHPSSVLMASDPPIRAICFFEMVQTSKEYARSVMPIKVEWLYEVAPHYFKKQDVEALEDKKMPKASKARAVL